MNFPCFNGVMAIINSIIMKNCKINSEINISDSIITDESNIENIKKVKNVNFY